MSLKRNNFKRKCFRVLNKVEQFLRLHWANFVRMYGAPSTDGVIFN